MKIIDLNGKKLWSKTVPVKVESNSSMVCFEEETSKLLENIDAKNAVFMVSLKKGKEILSSNYLYFTEPKNLELQKPEIKKEIAKTGDGYTLTLSANTVVRDLYLDYDGEGHFSDNFFDLFPGQKITVSFTPENDEGNFENKLKLFSLVDTF